MSKEAKRNSSFELLRIFCIYGIVSMHSFGHLLATASGVERVYACCINSVFNMGVTLFMLISGYFAIHFSVKKMVKLFFVVTAYSFANVLFSFLLGHYFSVKELVLAFFAIFTNRYWFATAYVIIFMLSRFINDFVKSLSKSDFEKLLFVLIAAFVFAPTLLLEQILNDAGKGVVNMFLVYIVGRYIRIYDIHLPFAKAILCSIITICFLFAITLSVSVFMYRGGVWNRFCYDNSLFIFFGAIFTFLAFRELNFYNGAVNILAKSVFAVYLFEGTIRRFVELLYSRQPVRLCVVGYNMVVPILVIVIVYIIETLRTLFFSKFEDFLIYKIECVVKWK